MSGKTASTDTKNDGAAANAPIRFDDRVVIITGAGRGLGRAHAELFGRLGATVIVNDLGVEIMGDGSSSGPADEVAAAIEAEGGQAVADVTDVTSYADVQRLIESTVERFGSLDAVITNAGITGAREKFEDINPERWDKLVQTHLYGTYNVLHSAWPHLKATGRGRAVVTISNGGLFGAAPHYSAAKMGIVGLMRALANEGRADNMLINAVAPGGYSRTMANVMTEEAKARMQQLTPPEAVSPTYAWLAHETCNVTGEIMGSSGGRLSRVFVATCPGRVGYKTPEDVRDHWDDATAEEGYKVPLDVPMDGKEWITALSGENFDFRRKD